MHGYVPLGMFVRLRLFPGQRGGAEAVLGSEHCHEVYGVVQYLRRCVAECRHCHIVAEKTDALPAQRLELHCLQVVYSKYHDVFSGQ